MKRLKFAYLPLRTCEVVTGVLNGKVVGPEFKNLLVKPFTLPIAFINTKVRISLLEIMAWRLIISNRMSDAGDNMIVEAPAAAEVVAEAPTFC
jgi:hypothetical protein